MKVWRILPILFLGACGGSSVEPSTLLTLKQANENPAQYRGQLVKVCGMATKQFENVQITEHRDQNWRDTTSGLGVNWLDGEPRTQGPERRCVTGKLEPLGGWEMFDARAAGNTDDIVISTGHIHRWEITQTTLARD